MSTESESSPLLSKQPPKGKQQKHCSCSVNYRLPMITEKGAIVMIVCNVLVLIAAIGEVQRISLHLITNVAFIVMSFIIFPIVGIVADTWVGRFKTIQASIVLLMASSSLNILLILLQNYLPSVAKAMWVLCTTGLCCMGTSCYLANAFPFVADQLIGASGEQLSFAVYWIMCGAVIAYYTVLLKSIPGDYFDIVAEALPLLCISVMALTFIFSKNLLTILPQLFNPYKLIFRVLNYVRKHKYPERRSALTYWEEAIPSRIDLGMNKYGGPFTVEEVEDVKTFFRLLPVLIFGGGCSTGMLINWYILLDGEKSLFEVFKPKIFFSYLSQLILLSSCIPIYHFLLYPLFYNYIPTIFNRIRVGHLLLFFSHCMFAFVGEMLVCNSPTNTTCLLFQSEVFNITLNGGWWVIMPSAVANVGLLLSIATLFEFVCAQSPRPLIGLLTGLAMMSSALSSMIGYGISELVPIIISKWSQLVL